MYHNLFVSEEDFQSQTAVRLNNGFNNNSLVDLSLFCISSNFNHLGFEDAFLKTSMAVSLPRSLIHSLLAI